MANNFASGGLWGPTAIGWAQAIVGAGIINVDIANIASFLLILGASPNKFIFPRILYTPTHEIATRKMSSLYVEQKQKHHEQIRI